MKKTSMMLALASGAALAIGACDDSESRGDSPDGRPVVADAGADAGRDAGLDAGGPTASDAAVDAGGARQAVMLRFKGKVGSQDLACGQSYPGQGSKGTTITPRDFRFFVHNVRLISSSGVEVPVALDERLPYQSRAVALVDFANGTGRCDPADTGTNTLVTGTVPVGSYTGVAFVGGVPEALNHADPSLHPGPLQAPGASWGWTLGFRFVMAEVVASAATSDGGTADAGGHTGAPIAPPPDAGAGHGGTDASAGHGSSDAGAGHGSSDGGSAHGGGGGVGGLGFVHLGSTGCSGTQGEGDAGPGVSCDKPNRPEVRLTQFNPVSSSIVADLGAVFSKADLSSSVQCHGSGPACAPMFEALGVNIGTGAALPTQQVFRVE